MASYVPQELAEAGENGQPMSVKTQGQCGLALIVGADKLVPDWKMDEHGPNG